MKTNYIPAAGCFRPATRRVRRARARSLLATVAVAILGFFVLLCVGLLTPVLWTVIVESGEPKPRACETIKNAAERAACFEAQRDASAHPAKGATAPVTVPDAVGSSR